jgi:hypothetical protein
LLSVVVAPTTVCAPPVMLLGNALTVTCIAAWQVPIRYVIIVVPAARPVITPVASAAEATPPLLLLHVPPVVALLNEVVVLTQIDAMPLKAPGEALTVATTMREQPVVADVYRIPVVPEA